MKGFKINLVKLNKVNHYIENLIVFNISDTAKSSVLLRISDQVFTLQHRQFYIKKPAKNLFTKSFLIKICKIC